MDLWVNIQGTTQGKIPHSLTENKCQGAGSCLGTPEGHSTGRLHSNQAEVATWPNTLGLQLRLRKGTTSALGKD